MEEALKSLKVGPKILARRSNALWDILLNTEEEAKQLTGNLFTTKSVCLQTENMRTRKTKLTVHGVFLDISEERSGSFLTGTAK